MIIGAIISWVLTGITAVFSLVPSWTPPTFDSPPAWLGMAMAFNNIVPIGFLIILVLATIVIYGLMTVFDLGFKVYHQFWGSN